MPEKKGKLKSEGKSKRQPPERSKSRLNNEVSAIDDLEQWKKSKELQKPPDQLVLSDVELKEEIARVLTTAHSQHPDNLVEYNYAQGTFLSKELAGNTIVVFVHEGNVLHRDTEEGKAQIEALGDEYEDYLLGDVGSQTSLQGSSSIFKPEEELEIPAEIEAEINEGEGEEEGEEEEKKEEEEEGEGEGRDEDDEGDVPPEPPPTKGRKKKLTNQFNFSERAALTYNLPIRSHETQTIPPPRGDFSGLVLQWIIFDAYDEDFAIQQKEKEKEKKILMLHKKDTDTQKKKVGVDEEMMLRQKMAWKTLERMVNLNTYDDVAKDFRYYEDPSDEYRDEEGTLLPLWKFSYEKTKKNMVTDILWNPTYYDLFAVCFGSFNFTRQMTGAVCLFTLKNPSYPEHICMTSCGVMCVDIHKKYPFMLVIGLYDGSVFVYNVSVSCKTPQYKSDSVTNKHRGIVWEVKWGEDLQDGDMNFYSAAGDGKINNWVLMQNELALTTIINLELEIPPVAGPDGIFFKLIASASCLAFHPKNPLIFLVGTEEGLIYKCSTLYSSTYLFTYKAHHMPVYRIDYNKFNENIFVSCSGDWRIKVWEDMREEPLFVFDLGSPVGDVKWAVYSSTVFAAVCSKGKVHVFDLNVNKYRAICTQAIVSSKKNELTRLAFNLKLPILIVGDDKGCVHTLKLSPNLRIPCKPPKKQQHLDQFTLQCMKLDKLLALVREPQVLELPEDVETVCDD